MAMTVADTDVLIDFLAGREPAFFQVGKEITFGRLLTTSVTRFELMSGVRTAKQRHEIETLLGCVPTLPLDADEADRAANVRRQLEVQGQGIGFADSMISGIVLERGATLMTRNLRHFERVPGLAMFRWEE